MDFWKVVSELSAMGYKRAAARAKIAHDVVLAAIRSSGMKGFVTIKGGVVMSGITKAVRRATMDMDVDFVRRSMTLYIDGGDRGICRKTGRCVRLLNCR